MFEHEKYINLRTFKKNLSTVDTPIWCVTLAEDSNNFYAFTNRLSGKVKRIKNNRATQVCSCDFKGKPIGNWVKATAVLSEEHQICLDVIKACKRKYGWQMHLLEFASTVFNRKKNRLIIQMRLQN